MDPEYYTTDIITPQTVQLRQSEDDEPAVSECAKDIIKCILQDSETAKKHKTGEVVGS